MTITGIDDVMALLTDEVNIVRELEHSLGRARTLGYLSGFLLKAIELGSLEDRLRAIELRLDELLPSRIRN